VDLSAFETSKFADQGSVMTIMHPQIGTPMVNDDASPMTITVYGSDGEKVQAARRAAEDRARKLRRTTTKTAKEDEDESLDLIIAATASWNVTFDGEKKPCTPENLRAAYRRFPWLTKQVVRHMAEEANFTPAS
jgi:beta-galactosidase/beta-glucuronidase